MDCIEGVRLFLLMGDSICTPCILLVHRVILFPHTIYSNFKYKFSRYASLQLKNSHYTCIRSVKLNTLNPSVILHYFSLNLSKSTSSKSFHLPSPLSPKPLISLVFESFVIVMEDLKDKNSEFNIEIILHDKIDNKNKSFYLFILFCQHCRISLVK